MAGALVSGGVVLQPSAEQIPVSTNYISDFDFLNQYLPDTYEKEVARYGNRTVSGWMRALSAEIPFNSDLIKWSEQGRLHTKYIDISTSAVAGADTATFTVNDTLEPGVGGIAIRVNQTVLISDNAGAGFNKAIVTAVDTGAGTFTVAFYEAGGLVVGGDSGSEEYTVFIYGSEFKKGTNGMQGSLESQNDFFENSPIILKDNYDVNGSDMAQIGWVNIGGEDGAPGGYLWYLKSEHDTRVRFDDYLETSLIEAVPALAGSGAIAAGFKGSDGIFYSVEGRGNVWGGGYPTALSDWDTIIKRLDKQGAIEENAVFQNRDFSLATDDMLAEQNSYGAGGTSYGMFQNSEQMALNLGFTGFRRTYDFYKSSWKYLNDPTMRGGLISGVVSGLLVPGGTTSVYDQVMGENMKRPFLHTRYRQSERENRKYKTWITGGAGGAATSDLDAMKVSFLSERCVCTLGANNFMLFKG